MVKVIAWPPVPVVGYEFSPEYPVASSVSGIDGAEFVSQSRPTRRAGALQVLGVDTDLAVAGTLEMLRREIAGVNLVRIETIAAHWHLAHAALRGEVPLKWTSSDVSLNWTSSGNDLNWTTGRPLHGVPFVDAAGFSAVTVTGLLPGSVAAWPGELVTVAGVAARVYRKAIADDSGIAALRVDTALTESGPVIIGQTESVVYRLSEFSRPLRALGQQFAYDFRFRETFEEDTDGFVEVDPWR